MKKMARKLLVIISSGEEAMDKALTGMMYAMNVKKNNWLDDVKVIFFGPSERMIINAESDSQVGVFLKRLIEQGITPMACRAIAEGEDIIKGLSGLGIEVEYVGPLISSFIKNDYAIITF